MRLRTVLGAASVVVATASYISAFAQNAVIEHPADIRAGSCASLGEVVAPLAPLVVPDGETVGHEGASSVPQSVTEVPLALADLLSESSAITVHASPDQVGTPIACGELGGTLTTDGSLSVGLQGMNGAKLSGVASLAPTLAGDATLVTVLLVDERGGRERPDAGVDGADDAGDGVRDDDVDGAEAADGSTAPDGVGNIEIGPAPDTARGADGVIDRPGQDRILEGAADSGRDTDGGRGIARAGEDGTSR